MTISRASERLGSTQSKTIGKGKERGCLCCHFGPQGTLNLRRENGSRGILVQGGLACYDRKHLTSEANRQAQTEEFIERSDRGGVGACFHAPPTIVLPKNENWERGRHPGSSPTPAFLVRCFLILRFHKI